LSAAFRISTEAPKHLSAAFRIGTEAPKHLSAAFRISTEEPKQKFWPLRPGRRSQNFCRQLFTFYEKPKTFVGGFSLFMKSPKLLSAAFHILWIRQNNRFGFPTFGGKANFAATNGNIRRLHMQKTTIRIGPSLFLPTHNVIEPCCPSFLLFFLSSFLLFFSSSSLFFSSICLRYW
jgi:hypothetical protein